LIDGLESGMKLGDTRLPTVDVPSLGFGVIIARAKPQSHLSEPRASPVRHLE